MPTELALDVQKSFALDLWSRGRARVELLHPQVQNLIRPGESACAQGLSLVWSKTAPQGAFGPGTIKGVTHDPFDPPNTSPSGPLRAVRRVAELWAQRENEAGGDQL